MQNIYTFFADALLLLHTLVVLFIIGAFVVIWIGYFKKWHFVRNFWFRVVHMALMGYVAVQTLSGFNCPLTVWENQLRVKGGVAPQYTETFIGHWLGKLLFYEVSLGVFAVIYTAFFAFVVLTWFRVKPESPRHRRLQEKSA